MCQTDEITEAEEAWTMADRIRALDEGISGSERLENRPEAMLPVDVAGSSEAEEYLKVRRPFEGAFAEPPEQAVDETVAACTCRINAAVEKEWARAMRVGDCVTLLRALKTNPCLLGIRSPRLGRERTRYETSSPARNPRNAAVSHLTQTGTYWGTRNEPSYPMDQDNTVLHWAAKRKCLKLLVYILSLFLDEDGKVVKEFVHGVTKIDRKDFIQRPNDIAYTADRYLRSWADYSIYKYFLNIARPRKSNLSFTLKEMQLEILDPMYVNPLPSQTSAASVCAKPDESAKPDENVSMREIVLKATKKYKMLLDNRLLSDYDYNFMEEYDELLFHFACGHLDSNECEEYVRAVIREVAKDGPAAVTYLFSYRNAHGKAPLHIAYFCDIQNRRMFLELLKVELGMGEECGDYYNSRDFEGWTVLHVAALLGDEKAVKALLKERRVSVNAEVKGRGPDATRSRTALHIAIENNKLGVALLLIEHGEVDVNAPLVCYTLYKGIEKFELHTCTPLYLATILGRSGIVKALIDHPKVKDGASTRLSNISAIHIAAIQGNPKILRYLINDPKFDISIAFKGCTALHFNVDGSHLDRVALCRRSMIKKRDWYLYIQVNHGSDKDRVACISMLIQAGLDIWQKNDKGNFPEPGPYANNEIHDFWYGKLLTETQDAKNNLNIAGNAISVVSALVATASYVGPLQPPLGLDSNSVQDGSLPIRIYMVTNTLSFYTAVASIIFAVVPSLPMPQEGLYEEWQRSQKSLIYAIHLLLLAVTTILISFGAASNVVVSSEYSWQHRGLVFYPTLLGGTLCVIAISSFYLRLFRLAFVKNVTIKHIYQHVFRAIKKEKVMVKVKVESEDDSSDEDDL